MAAIKKANARTFCARGLPTTGVYPHGVGGVEGKPVFAVEIGNHTIYLTRDDVAAMKEGLQRMEVELSDQ